MTGSTEVRREDVFSELVRLETELWNAVDTRLRAEVGVTLGHYEVMRTIDGHQACRVNDIAADLVVTVGGISKLVDRVEAAGHCRRRPNPTDARSSIIVLTAAGRRILQTARTVLDDELARRLSPALSPKRMRDFASTLAIMRNAVAQNRQAS